MKRILLSLAAALIAGPVLADIQDPPMNDYGPTRKLGRGLSNILYGLSELPITMAQVNADEGNSAAFSYGLAKGIARVAVRLRWGVIEFVTHPFPTYKQSFRPPYRSNLPWIHGGYEEFPPELGFQSRKNYCTSSPGY